MAWPRSSPYTAILASKGVVENGHLEALVHTDVVADPGQGWRREAEQGARAGQIARSGVFCVDPSLNGVSARLNVRLVDRQALSRGGEQLQPDEVQAGYPLGDRVLDLEPGVDLKEVEIAVGIKQELDCAGVGVVYGGSQGQGGAFEALSDLGGDGHRGSLLDDLLEAALDGALPLPEAQQVAVGIADDLHLDVPGPDDVLFEDYGVVPEGGHGLPSGALHGFRKLAGLRDGAHSPPPTPESGLDEDGIADLPGLLLYGFGSSPSM